MKKNPETGLADILFALLEGARKTVAKRKPLDAFVTQQLRQKKFTSRDRRLLANTLFSWFRWLGWVRQLEPLGPETQAAFAYLLDGQQEHALIKEFLSRSMLNGRDLFPLGKTPLVEKREAIEKWLKGLSVLSFSSAPELLVPEWFAEEVYYPRGVERQKHLLRCIESFQCRPPTWLSVDKSYIPALVKDLTDLGLQPQVHPFLEGAVAVHGSLNLEPIRGKWRGLFFVQDLTSQAVVKVCSAEPGQSWWDACAGAGGKTLGLARSMKGQGRILATDRRAGILAQLTRRARELSAEGISIGVMDVTATLPTADDFDGVLVDAPCSAIGTWSRNPDARWRTNRNDISSRAQLQAKILRQAARKVKPGGVLVYAVCTLSRKETEEVLLDFLSAYPEFSPSPLPNPITGEETPGFFWIWPWEGPGDGMFIARMVRKFSKK